MGKLNPDEPSRQVLLTFDDGPDPRYTPQVLEILRHYNIRALFFVVGIQAEAHGDLLRQVAAEGHALGNHGYTHNNIDLLTPEQLREEVRRTDAYIVGATGITPFLFRPPRGRYNQQNRVVLRQEEKQIMLWDAGLEKESLHDPSNMVECILKRISGKKKLILLLHDGDLTDHDRYTTVEALPVLIEELLHQGFTFVNPSSAEGKQFMLDQAPPSP